MGRYLGSWKIDDVIRVHKQTSSVTTGAATDADAAPTWRMYEDDTATPVTTGSFSTLNAQVGLYVAAITLAAAIGYEKGKTYAIRSQATVGGVIGADVDSFQIEAEVDANTVSGTVPTVTSVTNAVTVGSTAAAAIAALVEMTVGATAQAAIADAVWDEPKAGHTTADTYGEYLDATVSGISGGAGDTTVNATAAAAIAVAVWAATRGANNAAGSFGEGVASVQGNVTGSVASVTNAVTVGSTAASAIATATQALAMTVGATAASAIAVAVQALPLTLGATSRAAIVDDVWDEPKAGHTTADTYGEYLDSTTGAIKTDTAAIKAKTDSLTFTVANQVNANIKYVNDVSVTGNGQSGTEWGPGS